MRSLLGLLAEALVWIRRNSSNVASTIYAPGREALLRRTEARTRLEELAVDQKRAEIEMQRAKNVIDLVQKIEKIKDPGLRERTRAALSANKHLLPPPDEPATL